VRYELKVCACSYWYWLSSLQLTLTVVCAWGKRIAPCSWAGTDTYIVFKSTLGRSSDVFCAYKVQFFYVVLCVIRAVHKSDLRLVTNETPNKWRPVERTPCSDTDSCFWQDLYVTQRLSSRVLKVFYLGCAGQLHSLELQSFSGDAVRAGSITVAYSRIFA